MTAHVDFASEALFRDPAAAVAELRASGPIVKSRFPIIGTVWITTTYEAASRMLKDSATFSLRKESGSPAGIRWWMPKSIVTLASNMLTMDEPDHTRLRSIVDEAFRRRAVVEMEPHIRAIADSLANRLFTQSSPADLVAQFARILPLSVICELLGLPPTDRPKFIGWANSMTQVTGTFGFFLMIPRIKLMKQYLRECLRRARDQGGEGLIAELVRVEK
jgi:cytochrome P450 PksS